MRASPLKGGLITMVSRLLITTLLVLAGCGREQPEGVGSPAASKAPTSTTTSQLAQDAEEVLSVGGSVLAPRLIERVEPEYPDHLEIKTGQAGIIILEAIIDKSGMVREVIVKRGQDNSATAYAVAAVKRWRFAPATQNGKPVPVRFVMTVNIHVR